MRWVYAPFPLQPKAAGFFRVEVVLDFESQTACKGLGSFSDDEMMIRLIHYRLGNEGRGAYTFERSDTAGTSFRSVHAT